MNGFYAVVVSALKAVGFFYVRQKGSHQTWSNGKLSVTVSTNCESRHTANSIMKQAGLRQRF